MTKYLDGELFPLQLEGQVLVIREVTCQTVQVGNLANMEQTCKEQPEPILGMKVQARNLKGAKVKAEKNNKSQRKRCNFSQL